MLYFLLRLALYGTGMVLGFFLTGFIVPKRELSIEKEKALLELEEIINFPYKYMDEVEEMPDVELTEEELNDLKYKTTTMDIPFGSNKVLMFYDHETNTFKYYSNSDLIYKYLNVVCRKYVLDHDCKQIYKFDTLSTLTTHCTKPISGPFVQTSTERTTLDKNSNKFLRLGTLEDYKRSKVLEPVVSMGVLEFMRLNAS